MYRLRQMELNDKVCEQVNLAMLQGIYPQELIERLVAESQPWKGKRRRVRKSTARSLVLFLIAMGLWTRFSQKHVWDTLVGKLTTLHPGPMQDPLSDSAISARRQVLGTPCLQALMQHCCRLIATPETVPSAFFGRYRLMALDGTLFRLPDTPANDEGFGRGSNQFGPVAYPQARCVLLCECGTHTVVGLDITRFDVSEVHGAHRLVQQLTSDMLVMVDAGLTSAGLIERVRERGAHFLAALETGCWEHLPHQRRLADGSVLVWLAPTSERRTQYPQRCGRWVRIISYRITDERLGEVGKVYRVITTLLNPRVAPAAELIERYHERWEIELVLDEIKTHERAQCKVLRSKTPQGVRQELYGIFLAHYAVRALMAQSAIEAQLDPDRLSFTHGLFELCEMMDLAQILEPHSSVPQSTDRDGLPIPHGPVVPIEAKSWTQIAEGKQEESSLKSRLLVLMRKDLLPPRRLRINRREIKQIYNKYKPKKRSLAPPEPFGPNEQFRDFVELLDPLCPPFGTS